MESSSRLGLLKREKHNIKQSDPSLFTNFPVSRDGHLEYSDQSNDVIRKESFRDAISI